MDPIRVSVAIPALNEEHYLPALLRSLCAQRGVVLDVIVAEGHSDDRTVEAVERVAAANTNPDVTIRVFTVDQRNVSYQRNYAVARARFDQLLFLDADVRLLRPDWLRMVVGKHRRRGAAISTCRFRPTERSAIGRLYYDIVFVFHQVMRWITPYAIGAMLLTDRAAFDRVGGFNTGLVVNEDANFVKRVARSGCFEVLPDVCGISARRFLRGGFFKTGLMYVRIFLHRTLYGECRGDLGYWDQQTYDGPAQ